MGLTNTMPEERTAENFRRLPLLLSRAEIVYWGIARESIAELAASGELTFTRFRPNGRRRYHKLAVAKLLGFET